MTQTDTGSEPATASPEQSARDEHPTKLIVRELVRCGIELVPTLPDGWFERLFDEIDNEPSIRQVRVSAEPEGLGICAGAFFGGVGATMIMANAGLMLSGYHLPTLATIHRIPMLLLVAYRGTIGDTAFYQEQQGLVTEDLLQAMRIKYSIVKDANDVHLVSDTYAYARVHRRPAVVLLTKGALI